MAEVQQTFEQIAEASLDKTMADTPVLPTPATETPAAETTIPAEGTPEAETPTEGQPEPTFMDRLTELGFNDVSDEPTAQQRILEAYAQERAQAEQYKQQLEYYKQQQQFAQQPAPVQTPVEQPATNESWWKAPSVDENLVRQFATGKDENGAIQWMPETPLQLRADYENRQNYIQDWARKLVENPVEAFAPIEQRIQHAVEQRIEQMLTQRETQVQQQSAIQEFTTENANWLYQTDPVTNQPKVGADRLPLLSEAGAKLDALFNGFLEKGFDQTTALEAARGLYQVRYGEPNKQAAKATIQNNRLAHLQNAATNTANRNGHGAARAAGQLTGQAARTNRSFEEMFVENLGVASNS